MSERGQPRILSKKFNKSGIEVESGVTLWRQDGITSSGLEDDEGLDECGVGTGASIKDVVGVEMRC